MLGFLAARAGYSLVLSLTRNEIEKLKCVVMTHDKLL